MPRKNPLQEVLEWLKWAADPRERSGAVLIITHRGATGDVKRISFMEVREFDGAYIHVEPRSDERDFNYAELIPIPYHRIEKIVSGVTGRVLYKKGRKGGHSSG